jgi:hypothetical protein
MGRGQVAYLNPNVPATSEMIEAFKSDDVPIENRLRFACACMECHCVQWSGDAQGGRCGLADRAVETVAAHTSDELPNCGIRSTCRWFAQHQTKACAVCPEVIRRPAEL